eukprot:COSAG01_NODE_1803_length_9197_cov_11.062321_3_plen_240_part_00
MLSGFHAVLAEIYLCNVCAGQEILKRPPPRPRAPAACVHTTGARTQAHPGPQPRRRCWRVGRAGERTSVRVRVKVRGLIINKELTEISLRFYIFATPLSPPHAYHRSSTVNKAAGRWFVGGGAYLHDGARDHACAVGGVWAWHRRGHRCLCAQHAVSSLVEQPMRLGCRLGRSLTRMCLCLGDSRVLHGLVRRFRALLGQGGPVDRRPHGSLSAAAGVRPVFLSWHARVAAAYVALRER